MTNLPRDPDDVQVIRPGKYVSLTYSIRDEGGALLEQTELPVGYIHGGNTELIGGMDDAVTGKQCGDEVDLLVPPDAGFGAHDPSLIFTDRIENVPPEYQQVGAEVEMQNESGEVKTFYVTRIDAGVVTVDGNHPLAGKTLQVHVRIQEVRDPTPEEIEQDGGLGTARGSDRLH